MGISENFLILRRTEQDMMISVYASSGKIDVFVIS